LVKKIINFNSYFYKSKIKVNQSHHSNKSNHSSSSSSSSTSSSSSSSSSSSLSPQSHVHNLNLIEANKISSIEAFNVALFNATATPTTPLQPPPPPPPPPPHVISYNQQHDESAAAAATAATFASTHSNLFENTLLFHPQHTQMPFNIAAVAAAAYSNFKQCAPLAILQNQHQHHHPFSTSVNPSQSTSPSPSSLYQRNYLEALRFYKAAYESK
jgi:hypothetical protein